MTSRQPNTRAQLSVVYLDPKRNRDYAERERRGQTIVDLHQRRKMTEFYNEIFTSLRFKGRATIANRYFADCRFENCVLTYPKDAVPENRTKIIDCSFQNCAISGKQAKVYIKNTLFENIKSPYSLFMTGTIFDNVVLKGSYDRILLSSYHNGMFVTLPEIDSSRCVTGEELAELNAYADAAYKKIDRALDISQAEFREIDLKPNIPAHLIVRNSETQALLTYEKVKASNWENSNSLEGTWAKRFCAYVEDSGRDEVIIASIRKKEIFKKTMEAIKILREEGIAELY